MGGSSVLTTLANIAKTKVVAVVLGPQGVGAIGILGSLTSVMAVLAGMGLSSAAVRPIARALQSDDRKRLASLAAGLSLVSFGLGAVGAGAIWLFRRPLYDLAELSFGEARETWAAVAIGLAVFASAWLESKKAWIVGAKRPLDWARVTLIGGVVAAFVGAAAALVLEETPAVLCLVVALPVCSALVASWRARGLAPPIGSVSVTVRELRDEMSPVLQLGAALMVTSLMVVGTLFAAQWIVKSQHGIAAVGHFQASWTISATCVGFFFGALWMDYSPRLSAAAEDRGATTTIMNEQLYLSLLLAAPALLWLLALAPSIVRLLYSADFFPSAAVLRWQALGDLVRVAEASLGFVLVVQSRRSYFLFKELMGNAVFLGVLWGGIARFGLPVAGFALLVAQAFRIALIGWFLHRDFGFAWDGPNRRLAVLVAACAVLLMASVQWSRIPWSLALASLATLSVLCWFRLYRALRPDTDLVSAG